MGLIGGFQTPAAARGVTRGARGGQGRSRTKRQKKSAAWCRAFKWP